MTTYVYTGEVTLSFEVTVYEQLDLTTKQGKRDLLEQIYQSVDWDSFNDSPLTNVEVEEVDEDE
jgi:hypothetical protein